jgi:hypothetical protein
VTYSARQQIATDKEVRALKNGRNVAFLRFFDIVVVVVGGGIAKAVWYTAFGVVLC